MGRPKVLYVVEHLDVTQTLEQARLAMDAGADGVFLTSPAGSAEMDELLVTVCFNLKREFGVPKVGLDLQATPILDAAHLAAACEADMLWDQDCGVSSAGLTPEGWKLQTFAAQHPHMEVFASVAPTGATPKDVRPETSVRVARQAGFIPTTGGRPGGELMLAKVRNLWDAAEGRLALSSHVTADNVARFSPYVSHIIVGQAVRRADHPQLIDADKLRQLAANAEH